MYTSLIKYKLEKLNQVLEKSEFICRKFVLQQES